MTEHRDADGLPTAPSLHPRRAVRPAPTEQELQHLDELVLEAWVDAGDDEVSRAYAMGLSVAAATVRRPTKVWASPERQKDVAERAGRRRISQRIGRADALADIAGYLRELAEAAPGAAAELGQAADRADELARWWNRSVRVGRPSGGRPPS